MSDTRNILLDMVRCTIKAQPLDTARFEALTNEEWKSLFKSIAQQGVLAMTAPMIETLPKGVVPRPLLIRWAVSADNIRTRYRIQADAAKKISDKFTDEGIDFFVLKGLGVSTYYPTPENRECGDIDCFLGSNYERGNQIAESIGAEVSRDYYKHSHIVYDHSLIENHAFCISLRGDSLAKELERELENTISKGEKHYIKDTKLLLPSAEFNVLFLARHALLHFLNEGINLRHAVDWCCFMQAEADRIDWTAMNPKLEHYHLKRFTDALTTICIKHLGLNIDTRNLNLDESNGERVLDDMFGEQAKLFNKGYSPWRSRYETIRNILHNRWRYNDIYGRNFAGEIVRYACGFLFERKPKL